MYVLIFFRLLTDKKITNIYELQNALKKLHQIGPQIVAVSSTEQAINGKLTAVVSAAKGWWLYIIIK